MPDPQKLLVTLRRAAQLFRATPGRVGAVVHLDQADDVMVVGDLHGHLETMAQAMRVAALEKNPGRHLVLQELVPDDRDLENLDLGILKTGVWSPESVVRGGTVYALTWGRDTAPETVDRFARLVDADLFITGHHPCDDGFRVANHRHVILDGTDP